MIEVTYEVQQECPKENWIGCGDRWVTVATAKNEDAAEEMFGKAAKVEGNWPTRLVEVSRRVLRFA